MNAFVGLRVEGSHDVNLNPESAGEDNIPNQSSETGTGSPLPNKIKTKKRKKARTPWTEQDFRAYRIHRRERPLEPVHSLDMYAFLFEDLDRNVECLYFDTDLIPNDTGVGDQDLSQPATDTSKTNSNTTLHTGIKTVSSTEEPTPVIPDQNLQPEKDNSQWTWDPGGQGKITPDDDRGPSPCPMFLVPSIENTTGDELDIHSWK